MRDFPIWIRLKEELSREDNAVLVYVVDHTGSTPGKQGFKMLITAQGDQLGTIGGGIMELNLIDQANQILEAMGPKITFVTQAHHEKAPEEQQSGLICAGTQYVVLHYVDQQEKDIIDFIVHTYESDHDGIIELNSTGLKLIKNEQLETKYEFNQEGEWYFRQNIGHPVKVYVFGGGHVGRAITQALSMLDFYIILNDNRNNLDMVNSNPYPHEIRIDEYSKLGRLVEEGKNIYIVIVTYGFDFDSEVLAEVITSDVAYIGLMGSKAKLRRIFNLMRERGVEEHYIDRVHAPIGLDITNNTAEEIAISVAGELIDIKNSIQ